MADRRRRILLAVTADMSLRLMQGFPEYLVTRGWDVHVVSSPGPLLDELSSADGVTTHGITMAREPSPVEDLRALAAWVRLLRRVRPSLLSVGTPKAGLLGGIAGLLTRVPHRVYLLRGLRLESFSGPRRMVLALLEKFASSCAHRILAVSHSLRNRATALKLMPPEKIVVLGAGSSNGVESALYSRERFADADLARMSKALGLVPGIPVVGFVGRLTKDKGLEVLAETRAILERKKVDYQLLIVGGIDDSDGARILDAVCSTGRPALVSGQVDNPELYYQLMDILCLPTLREGFPNVVLEAAAAGVPTVTTTATGAIDSVIHGETGLIATVGSAESLSDQLALLLRDSELRSTMGANATLRVKNCFERTAVWGLTDSFYNDLTANERFKGNS